MRTKLTVSMKNMISCNTRSRSGVRLISSFWPLCAALALIWHSVLCALLLWPHRRRNYFRRRFLGVVIHLGQEVVRKVAGVHRDAHQAIAKEGVKEDGRHRDGHAQKRHHEGMRDALGQLLRFRRAALG